MGEAARHSREQVFSQVATSAFRRVRPRCLAATFLLTMALASAIACSGEATRPPVAPTESLAATAIPPTATEIPTVTHSPTPPAETPTATSAPAVPTETPVATVPPTPQPTAASPTPVPATATPTVAPTATPEPIQGSVVKINDNLFPVDLAITPAQRNQGLSGREVMDAGTGMLFIFENEGIFTFWMKEMHFPLDIVWVGADCAVVDVTLGAPPPEEGQSLADLPRFSPGSPALYVLEINAGEFAEHGIEIGDPVEFVGDLEGLYGC